MEKSLSIGVSTKVPITSVRTQGPSSWFRRDWFLELILILFVILAYTPVWKAGFVWDDETILTANPCIVGPLGLKEIWTTSAADICPLTLTTFWVEHALWGLNPLPYHLVNVVMHGLSAVVLWRVLRSLRIQGAWLGAALWALHPVAVESVAWITEMKNTESGLFFLLSILFFARWLSTKDLGGRTGGGWSYAFSLFFAALAMAAKSSTVILPVVLCLCAWCIEGRWLWRNVARTVPIFLMAIAASVLSIWTQRLQLAMVTDPQWARTWPERLAAAGDAVWFYLGKLLWPHPLSANYPRWQIDAGQWLSYLPLLAVIVILFIFWLRRGSGGTASRAGFFAFAYFIVALLPTLGLIGAYIFQFSLVFDHFQYLASIGPLALAGTALVRLSDFIISKKPWLQSALCAGLLLIVGTASWQQTWVYESEEAFWTDTLRKNPDSWMAHNNFGNVLFRKGQVDDAVAYYQKALRIYPNHVQSLSNLAGLTPTQTFANITASTTITATAAGRNVIQVNGITLNSTTLTLSGSATQSFVINITGSPSTGGGITLSAASILLSGGITPANVIFNVTNGSNVSLLGTPAVINGIVMDLNGTVALNNEGDTVNGEIISGQGINLLGGSDVEVVVPEPSTAAYFTLGPLSLLAVMLLHRHFSRRKQMVVAGSHDPPESVLGAAKWC